MKRFGLMFGLFFVMGLVALWGGMGQNTAVDNVHAATTTETISMDTDPCFPDDPFELEKLREILDSPNPPSVPTEINRFISIRAIGQAELQEEEDEDIANDAPFLEPDEDAETDPEEIDEDDIEIDDQSIIAFNTQTRYEFEIMMNGSMLQDIHTCRKEAGLTDGTFEADPAVDQLSQVFLPAVNSGSTDSNTPDSRARSNGLDTRIIFNNTTDWPFRTISDFRGCTGTLVGPRHVVTAAHCIYNRDEQRWNTVRVRPGHNTGSATPLPYGSSLRTNDEPWYYFTHPQWRNPDQTGVVWDWGLIIIPDRLGELAGWMGYAAPTASSLKQRSTFNRGYPLCSANRPDTPGWPDIDTGCFQGRLYGDLQTCKLHRFERRGANGWHRLVTHTCDTSAGQSGSPMYQYLYNPVKQKFSPVVVGVHFFSRCDRTEDTICTMLDTAPSVMRRHTPTETFIISFYRQFFP